MQGMSGTKEGFLAMQDGRVGVLIVVVAVISASRFVARVCVDRPRRPRRRPRACVMAMFVPAHRPVKRSTLRRILKQAEVSLDDFLAAL
jgi:hypothetical protein